MRTGNDLFVGSALCAFLIGSVAAIFLILWFEVIKPHRYEWDGAVIVRACPSAQVYRLRDGSLKTRNGTAVEDPQTLC